jgi:hypothetical protein
MMVEIGESQPSMTTKKIAKKWLTVISIPDSFKQHCHFMAML